MNKHANFLSSIGSGAKGTKHGVQGRNFRIMLVAAVATLSLAYYLPLVTTERYLIIILVAVVLSAELFNSAIEELADVMIQENHPGIARVKEMSAAAVLLLSLAAAIIGAYIFIPYITQWIA
jgi:diacylglycerol kinase